MTDFDLSRYIFWEYSLAVMFFTEMFKMLLKGVTWNWVTVVTVTNPKWLTLIVAFILGLGDWMFIDRGEPNYYQLLISFALAVIGYDYGLKLIKDLIVKAKEAFRKDDTP